jgi:hypothetical protein
LFFCLHTVKMPRRRKARRFTAASLRLSQGREMINGKRAAVVLPAYNAEKTLEGVATFA